LDIGNREETPAAPPVTLRLERKHLLAIRWMHWINFPLLFIMILSGIRIYWNDSDNAHLHPHAIYRLGFGSLTLSGFSRSQSGTRCIFPWHVTQGMGDHFFFMWLFALNGVAYVLYSAISGEWRFLIPRRGSLREAFQVMLASLHLRRSLPLKKKYNGAQRIAYSTVIAMGPGVLSPGSRFSSPRNCTI
jgi:thiosulfate reductase cytochrome b subunit